MKKALLVLLLLAVAGGLFAQVTWGGRVYGGFRVDFDDPVTLKFWNTALGSYANQARLYGTYKNDAGTLGGSIQFRGDFGSAASPNVTINTFYGWFTMFDKLVKINVGKWNDSEFNEQMVWAGFYYWAASRPGIAAYIYPADGIRFGVGLNTTNTATLLEDHARWWFGAAYEGESFGAYLQGAYQKDNFNMTVNGYYDADPILVAVYADLMRLDDYANHGEIDAGLFFGYYGVENVDAELAADLALYGADTGKDTKVSVGVYFAYYLDGPVPKVGIDFDYGITAGSLEIHPYLRFGLSSSRNYLELGYVGEIVFDPSAFNSSITLDYVWRF